MDMTRFPHLMALHHQATLQGAEPQALEALAEECRAFLLESISRTGGHLGAALGVVELTVALCSQFDFSQDRIVWDVGHQAHVYKLLTGRAGQFGSYGQWGGLSKFLDRSESPYDHMGAGHASTSISSALGMALARNLAGLEHQVVAVIGDGALTGGLAYEALNMAGAQDVNLLVVLNDNGMSIDHNVGAFSRTLSRLTASAPYNALRQDLKRMTGWLPFGRTLLGWLKHMERSVKDLAHGHTAAFFESLNFRYLGPVDGHDIKSLILMLKQAKTMHGPLLLHVKTVKGKGMGAQVENTFQAHAVSSRSVPPEAPASFAQAVPTKSWTEIFTEGMQAIMAADDKVVAITAAMCSNTGLGPLLQAYPQRVFDVGIAEANAYCSAAGMAIGGLKPFVAVYSTFTQRAFDQILHDIALQNLPVRMCLDRGGLVGSDGPTHHGVYDFSYLRLVPGLVHMAPRNELEFRRMLLTAQVYDQGPIAVRYPRGNTPAMTLPDPLEPIPIGQGEMVVASARPHLLLVAVGSMVTPAVLAAEVLAREGLRCAVVDARFVKPLDEALLVPALEQTQAVLTLEENTLLGGLGEAVLALMARHDIQRPARLLGVPDRFIAFGDIEAQLHDCGLTLPQIVEAAREVCALSNTSRQRRSQPA